MESPTSPTFPYLTNLSSQEVSYALPWEFQPNVPKKLKTKKVYKDWCANPLTEHFFYSGYIGVAPNLRIHNESNPIHSMQALIADYDCKISDSDLESMLDRNPNQPPNWVHKTFSGGARLVWIFDRPVLVPSQNVLIETLTLLAKSLDLKGLLPGFDYVNAYLNPNMYFDIGSDWVEVDGAGLFPASLVEGYILKTSERAIWKGEEIPFDVLSKEIEKKFPGRWEGAFVEGARGVRFWDALADSPSAAIVRKTGMQCFTGPEGFVSWAKIFGRDFVDQFSVKRLGESIEGVWYDGRSYWFQSADDKWESRVEREMSRWLKVERGLSSDKGKNETFSEVDHALCMIDQHKRVVGAAPFVYLPPGMIEFMGKRVLNTARVTPLQPAKEVKEWGDRFPWIADFLGKFFDSDDQLDYFLSWLKRFYCNALEGQPKQGQAVFIAGDPGQGKTLLSNRIISSLVGGHQDASQFLLGISSFNKELFHHGLWTVDDATPGDTNADHKKFSSLLKKVAANTTFEYHAKFQDSVMVEWSGRVIVTGNLDAESLRILPDLDVSILDKLMLFRASSCDKDFPDRYKLNKIIAEELPYLAAFLVQYEIPDECRSKQARYGVQSYHHPELRLAAGETTDAAVLEEIVQSWLSDRYSRGETNPWEGTATLLMQQLFLDESILSILGRNSAKWFAVQLGKLEAQKRGVTTYRLKNRRFYKIELKEIPSEGNSSGETSSGGTPSEGNSSEEGYLGTLLENSDDPF